MCSMKGFYSETKLKDTTGKKFWRKDKAIGRIESKNTVRNGPELANPLLILAGEVHSKVGWKRIFTHSSEG